MASDRPLQASPHNLYVGGLPKQFANNDKAIEEFFGAYGTIEQCKALPIDPKAPEKVSAMVRFGDPEIAKWLVDQCAKGTFGEGAAGSVTVRYACTPKASEQKELPVETLGPLALTPEQASLQLQALQTLQAAGNVPLPVPFGLLGQGPDLASLPLLPLAGIPDQPFVGEFPLRASPYQRGAAKGTGKGWGTLAKGGYGIAEVFGMLADQGTLGQRKPHQDAATLYVSGLPPDTDELSLFKIFSVFGGLVLKGIHAMKQPDGSCTGVAFIDYFQEEAALAAIDGLNGFQLPDGFTLNVNVKHTGQPKSRFTPQVISQMHQEMGGAPPMAGAPPMY